MTFDFTEIQYEGKTVAQAEADWAAQFNALTANAAGTPVVVLPVHDYGVAAWNTTTDSATGSPYTTQMYTDFIAQAYAKNYEFLTLEELAARTEAQQKAAINYTTVGNAITVTVTPDPTAPDLGGMALDVVNGGTEVIQNVTNWYAYNATELFLPTNGGTFTINLGTTQDDVTHIAVAADAGRSAFGLRRRPEPQLRHGGRGRCRRRPRGSRDHPNTHRHRRNHRQPGRAISWTLAADRTGRTRRHDHHGRAATDRGRQHRRLLGRHGSQRHRPRHERCRPDHLGHPERRRSRRATW